MERAKIKLPEKFNFSTEVKIRVSDINYGNHLGNDAVLSLAHEARIRYINELGYKNEIDIEGFGFIVTDAVAVYKSEAFLGDILTIEVAAANPARVGFDMYYRISKKFSGIDVAHVKTGIVFYDYSVKKVVAIPEYFLDKISL